MTRPLLPSGCYDLLPPYARLDTALQSRLLATFEAFGYAQVAPPLLEFTDSLLAGRGAALSAQVFRVMDPGAHKVMGVRADCTMQVARIAATRLADAPRPLRLSYAGNVLRMQPEGSRGGRQLRQAGIELIGAASAEADAEVIRVAAIALQAGGVERFTIDLNLPKLATALVTEDMLTSEESADLLSAIAHKDAAGLRAMKLKNRDVLADLVSINGEMRMALAELKSLPLPPSLSDSVEELTQVARLLAPLEGGGITLTVDPAEARGFEYHTGITFSILESSGGELARGGRYRLDTGEGATGSTLYVDPIRRLLPAEQPEKRVLVTDAAAVEALQHQGFVTLLALSEFGADEAEARRLGCTHYYNGTLTQL